MLPTSIGWLLALGFLGQGVALSEVDGLRPLPCALETCGRWVARALIEPSSPSLGPRLDPPLEKAAFHHATMILRDRSNATWTGVQEALATEGLADHQVLPFASTGPNLADLATLFADFAKERTTARGFTDLGVAVARATDTRGDYALVGLWARRLLEVAPLPRNPSRPRHLVRGRILQGRALEAVMELPGRCNPLPSGAPCPSSIRTLPITWHGRHFEIAVPTAATGTHRLELLVEDDRGPEVALLWTFELPLRPHPTKNLDQGLAQTTARNQVQPHTARRPRSEKELWAALQAIRGARDLAPLVPSAALARAAAPFAQEICRRRVAAHVLPGFGDPGKRARRAGYRNQVTENLAIAESLDAAHMNLLESPSHLRNIIDPASVEAGMAVFADASVPAVCVVQMFGLGR